jgi:predicted secreted protein
MAQATTMSFSKMRILLGDAGSPETFSAPCGLNTRALRRLKNTNEIDIPDCDDEDAAAWIGREVRSLDWSITGEGVLAVEAIEAWEAFFTGTTSKNVQIEIETGGSPGTITMNGAAHLTSYEVTANRGEKVSVSIELSGDGALVTA